MTPTEYKQVSRENRQMAMAASGAVNVPAARPIER
jgi:hypothetical protein